MHLKSVEDVKALDKSAFGTCPCASTVCVNTFRAESAQPKTRDGAAACHPEGSRCHILAVAESCVMQDLLAPRVAFPKYSIVVCKNIS